jgi:phytoene/squalene synthetase
MDRVYIPLADMRSFGVGEADLLHRVSPTPSLRALMAFEVFRARQLLADGLPLLAALRGRARWAVAGFWSGGNAALDAISHARFDVFSAAPRPRRSSPATRTLQMCAGLALEDRRR